MSAHVNAMQVCIQARVPVFLWGAPGIGKTAVTEQVTKDLNEPIWVVILSIREPGDQGGLPKITDSGVQLVPPRWGHELCEIGHGIIFWDEFNTAVPTLQASALRVIYEGYMGDLKLPAETSHVAAGNPPERSTGAFNLMSAIANRWVHIPWPNDATRWCDAMVAGFPPAPVVRVHEGWRDDIQAMRATVASFIRKRPELLHVEPESKVEQGRAWPSNRTWTFAAMLLAAAKSAGFDVKSEEARILVAGCVGEAAQVEFYSWYINLNLKDPEEYLAEPTGTDLPTRQDQIMATLDAVASAALATNYSHKERIKRYYSAWKVLGRVMKRSPDIAIPAARTLATNMPPDVDRNLPPELDGMLEIIENSGIDFNRRRA